MITNPIDPGTGGSQTIEAQSAFSTQYTDFLRLLTVSLQHQDPTNPTDTDQLTQQIATLSQVEQQINTNRNLEKLLAMFTATQYNSVVSYIGKIIEAPGNAGSLEDGSAMFAYYLEQDAAGLEITIKDSTGTEVYTGAGPMAKGRNSWVWDGKDNLGNPMPDGVYTIEVKATNASGNDIVAQTYTTGLVTSIDSVEGAVYASIGDLAVPLTAVLSVRLPEPQELAQAEPEPPPAEPEPAPEPPPAG